MKIERKEKIRCEKCGTILHIIDKSTYICDACKKDISKQKRVEIRVFYESCDDEVKEYHFCNWACCFNWIIDTFENKEADFHFIDFELDKKTISDFIETLKNLKT